MLGVRLVPEPAAVRVLPLAQDAVLQRVAGVLPVVEPQPDEALQHAVLVVGLQRAAVRVGDELAAETEPEADVPAPVARAGWVAAGGRVPAPRDSAERVADEPVPERHDSGWAVTGCGRPCSGATRLGAG